MAAAGCLLASLATTPAWYNHSRYTARLALLLFTQVQGSWLVFISLLPSPIPSTAPAPTTSILFCY